MQLSQSEYLDGHEMDVSRSVLLESPAAKSILGGEVARQKHEFYMSQSRMVKLFVLLQLVNYCVSYIACMYAGCSSGS